MTISSTAKKYYKKYKFRIEIDGVESAAFRACSDLRVQIGEVGIREGGALILQKDPGFITFPDITLTRGLTEDESLYNWMSTVVYQSSIPDDPARAKRHIQIVQLSRNDKELKRWAVYNAWVKEYKAADWGEEEENAMEEVVLAYDFFTIGGDRQAFGAAVTQALGGNLGGFGNIAGIAGL